MLRIGTQLRRLRIERGLTFRQLEKAVDITQRALASLEANESSPSGTNLMKLADFFGVTMDELRDEQPVLGPDDLETQLIEAGKRAQSGDQAALAEMRRLYARLGAAAAARTEQHVEQPMNPAPKRRK